MAANQSERQSEEQRGNTAITVTTTPPTLTPLVETKLKSACFKCKKQGHWAKDCPSNDNPTAKPSSPPLDTHLIPVLCCHCGVACTIHVSRSDANYGRPYYSRNCTCDKATRGRNFYKWCDDVKAPMCSCGAGACTVNNRRDENGKETKYFTCRIRTGHGACGFLQFESPTSSRPRSMEIDERPSTMRLRRGGLSDIITHEISVTGNSPNGYAEVDKVSQNALSQNALGRGTQPLCDPLGTSSLETSFIASEKVRKNLQKDFLSHLETIEPPDHNSMLQGVNDTFDASVSPLIECKSFAEHVVESFRGISIVAGMESTLKDNCNQSVPSVPKNIGKSLYDISGNNAETFATVTDTGNYHFRSVHEEASHIKDTLCQIEKLETYLLKTAKDVGQLKRYMQATNQELTKALKLTQEKEEQMHFNKDNIK
ncbi:uncharacterized protein LOC108455131 [Gossypium arboreum]|uniref:CCHC-type domain-containing protein n=1 Tax=Gossypium arboreum TaxID=29729 RepID=A0ABR0PA60_GOSAR|nr:uncharacterized protein LOC108455131 [Gossypium arboreum]KAK5818152.1 hypothetical protein PVK06_023085 [Gossypium arboreum]